MLQSSKMNVYTFTKAATEVLSLFLKMILVINTYYKYLLDN